MDEVLVARRRFLLWMAGDLSGFFILCARLAIKEKA
jgi:hypothetical protein